MDGPFGEVPVQLAWPERFTVALGVALALILLLFGAALNAGSSSTEWFNAGIEIWAHFARMFLLPLWIAFRVIDLFTGGPWRRQKVTGRSHFVS